MIAATPNHRRFTTAYDHIFRLSLALRALETRGKLVAAIAGLALGGGNELALAAHCRGANERAMALPRRRANIGGA